MCNAQAVSPFMDMELLSEVNEQLGLDQQPAAKIDPRSAQACRQSVHQAVAHQGSKVIQGSAPPTALMRAIQTLLRDRQQQ